LKHKSLLDTNTYRKPHVGLGEYTNQVVKNLLNCSKVGVWYSCDEGNGKVHSKRQLEIKPFPVNMVSIYRYTQLLNLNEDLYTNI
jgi:hypothetical protein